PAILHQITCMQSKIRVRLRDGGDHAPVQVVPGPRVPENHKVEGRAAYGGRLELCLGIARDISQRVRSLYVHSRARLQSVERHLLRAKLSVSRLDNPTDRRRGRRSVNYVRTADELIGRLRQAERAKSKANQSRSHY